MRLRCNPQPDFQGSTQHSWTQRELLRSLPSQNPFSPRRNSRDSAAYAEKTTLPRARVDVSGSFHVAMLIRGSNSSAIRLRNKDLIPFRPKLRSLQEENTAQFYRDEILSHHEIFSAGHGSHLEVLQRETSQVEERQGWRGRRSCCGDRQRESR